MSKISIKASEYTAFANRFVKETTDTAELILADEGVDAMESYIQSRRELAAKLNERYEVVPDEHEQVSTVEQQAIAYLLTQVEGSELPPVLVEFIDTHLPRG